MLAGQRTLHRAQVRQDQISRSEISSSPISDCSTIKRGEKAGWTRATGQLPVQTPQSRQ
jgi:hypothetical protein